VIELPVGNGLEHGFVLFFEELVDFFFERGAVQML
jgi:hypothetical protein